MRIVYKKLPSIHAPHLHLPFRLPSGLRLPARFRALRLVNLPWRKLNTPKFKTARWIALSILSILVLIVFLNLLNAGRTRAAWFDDSYAYRKQITIGNSGSAITTTRKVKIEVDTATLITAGKMQPTCNDTRFTNDKGELLEFFIDTNVDNCNTSSTDYFVKIDQIATPNQIIYMYYGNPSAPNAREGDFFTANNEGVGLVGYWNFDEGSGGTATDRGEGTLDASITGSTYVTGKQGTALTFDGTTGKYAVTASTSTLNNTTMSSSFWMKPNSTIGAAAFWTIISTTPASELYGWAFQYSGAAGSCPAGIPPCVNSRKWTPEVDATLTYTLNANEWYHIVQIWNNTNVLLYINGTLVSTVASAGPTGGSQVFCIGGDSRAANCASQNPDAVIDDVRVYKRILNATDVSEIYNNGQGTVISAPPTFVPTSGPTLASEEKTVGPIFNWKFDDGSGALLRDTSAARNNGVLSGTLINGTGLDGNLSVSSSVNLNTDIIAAGRSTYADGIAYRVTAPADSATSVTRFSGSDTISNGIVDGDEVMLINLRGTSTDTADVGNYEFMRVESVTSSVITFTAAITKSFDGTTASNQFVVVQRVPNYSIVTVNSGGTITASAFDDLATTPTGAAGYRTGIVAFRASQTVTVSSGGTVSANAIGYQGGVGVTGNSIGFTGETNRASVQQAAALNSGGGGGAAHNPGVCNPSAGGGGGYGAVGTASTNKTNSCAGAGSAGGTIGAASLSTLYLGGGGASGGGKGGTSGAGGKAGGIVFIGTDTITVAGTITTTGANGGAPTDISDAGGDSGGGGSGGSVLLQGTNVTVGSSLVTASGGTGGTTSTHSNGGNGGVGRIHIDSVTTISGTTSPAANTTTISSFAPVNRWQTEDQCVTGKCLYFNGTSDSANSLGGVDLSQTNAITIEYWAKYSVYSNTNEIAMESSTDCTAGTGCFLINPDDDTGKFRVYLKGDTGANDVFFARPNAGEWHHFAFVMNKGASAANEIVPYIDGRAVSYTKGTSSENTNNFANLQVFLMSRAGTSLFTKGFLDEVKIYNYARSASDVKSSALRGAGSQGSSAVFGQQDTSFLNKDLTGYWNLDEASGNAADSSGYATTMTNTNTATYTTGKFANAGTFASASSQYFTAADNANISMGDFDTTFTAWVNATTLGANRDILTKWGAAATNAQLEWQLGYSNSSLRFYFCVGDGTNVGCVNADTLGVPTASTWYFIVAQHDSVNNTIKISVNNGGMDSAAWTTGIQDNTYNLSIGRAGANNFNYWNGKIDEVRMYKRLLNEDELSSLYNWAPGPVAYWKMEEASGNRLDSSGNAQTLVENNGVTPGVHGQYGNAAYLQNTAGQYLSTPDTAKLSMGNLDFTVEAWVRLDNENDQRFIVSKGTANTTAGREFLIYYDIFVDRFLFLVSNGTTETITTSAITDTPNTWYHLAGYYDSVKDQAVLVVNGSSVTSTTNTTGSQDLGGNFTVGASDVGTSHFGGLIDEVKVYRYVRTMKQINEDMNGGHPAGGSPVASQFAYYKFDEQQGTVANNSNALLSSMTGSLAGGVAWKTPESGGCKANGCLNFDGVDDIVTVADNAALDATSSGTISLWVKPASLTQDTFAGLVTRATGGAASTITYSLVWRQTDGVIQGGISNGTTFISVPMPLLTDTNWHHIAFTWDQSNLKIYKDGILGGSIVNTAGITAQNTTMALNIGGDSFGAASGTDDFWAGSLDEVKLYNSALTATEILVDKNGGSGAVLGDQDSYPLEHTLSGWWKLDETNGTRLDSSGNGNSLASNNSVSFNPGNISSASAQIIRASNQYLSIADNTSLSVPNTDFTLSAWFYQDTTSAGDRIIAGKADAVGNKREYYIARFSAGTLGFTVSQDGTNTTTVTTPDFSNTASTWNFVVAWYDSAKQTINIQLNNGLVYSASHTTGVNDNTSPFMIGAVGTVGSPLSVFDGRIDDVRLYKRLLSNAERERLYNYASEPYGYWDLNEKTSTSATDKTGHGFTGTLTAGPVWTAGKTGGALNFDGVDDTVDLPLLNLPNNSDFSISAWVNFDPSSAGTTSTIFGGCNDPSAPPLCTGGDYDGVLIRKNANDQLWLSAYFFRSGAGSCAFITNYAVPLGRWTHVEATFDENDANSIGTIYVDGVKQTLGTNSCAGATSGAVALYPAIGGLKLSNNGASITYGQFTEGIIDEVKFYNYVRSPSQVAFDYNKGAPQFQYRFDECSGSTLYNNAPSATGSGTINNGTITIGGSGSNTSLGSCSSGTTTEAWNNGTTGRINQSLDLDGNDDYVSTGVNTISAKIASSSAVTVASWVKVGSYPGAGARERIVNAYMGQDVTGVALSTWDSSGQIEVSGRSRPSDSLQTARITENLTNGWHHLVGVLDFSNDKILVYMDGKLVHYQPAAFGTTQYTPGIVTSYSDGMGSANGAADFFDGQIDDTRIYNYGLTAEQVKVLYNNGAVSFMPATGAP